MSKKIDLLDTLLYTSAPQAGENERKEYDDASMTMTPSAKKKMMKRLEREKNYIERSENYHPVREAMKRVAVAALVVLSVGLAGVVSVEAVRTTLWDTVVEWYEDNIRILYVKNEALEAMDGIRDYREPVPGGEYVRYDVSKSTHRYCLEYERGDTVITYQQYLLENHAGKLADNYTDIRRISINGYEGILTVYTSEDEDNTMITWNDGTYLYRLSGNTTVEELLRIAETVK